MVKLSVFLKGFCAIAIAASLSACKSNVAIVERVRVDTTYISKVQRDSIYLHDSVAVRQEIKGETIYAYVDRWHTKYKYIVRVDTLTRARVDSIPYPVEIVRQVPRHRAWWEYAIAVSFLFLSFHTIKRFS